MSNSCPNFQMKIYASTQLILEFFHPERAALSLWGGNFLNDQCCCQTKKCSLSSLLKRCVTHEIFHLRTSTASLSGAEREGNSGCLSSSISWQPLSEMLLSVIWWNGWQTGITYFSCFVKSFCFQPRTTLERCLQTDSTPIFEELYFHHVLFFFFLVKS